MAGVSHQTATKFHFGPRLTAEMQTVRAYALTDGKGIFPLFLSEEKDLKLKMEKHTF